MKRHLVLPFLAASALAARADVLVVDAGGGPGAAFADIRAAVDSAAEGDTLLVRDGSYAPFVIEGKSLTVVADGSGVRIVYGLLGGSVPGVTVQDLAAGQSVLVQGLRPDFGVRIEDCAGSVWIDRLTCDSSQAYCSRGDVAGATVFGSQRVTLTRCTLLGEIGGEATLSQPSAPGVWVANATVQLFDCLVEGGQGRDEVLWGAEPGASGLRLESATVTLAGCTVRGGGGGLVFGDPCASAHAAGGAGVEFVVGSSTLRALESTAAGGVRSLEPLCPGQSGPAGPAISGTGTIVPLFGFARHLQVTSPVRVGERLTFDVEGRAGELALILVSERHEPLPLLSASGVLVVGLPQDASLVLPPLPASGRSSLAFPVPPLGGLAGGLAFHAQALFLDASTSLRIGAGASLVLLDAGL